MGGDAPGSVQPVSSARRVSCWRVKRQVASVRGLAWLRNFRCMAIPLCKMKVRLFGWEMKE